MTATNSLLKLPAPLRIAALVFFVVLVLSSALFTLPLGEGSDRGLVAALPIGSIGIAGSALGMILATDFRGSAWEYARLSKALGPDSGSRFLFRFIRIAGGFFVLSGVCFVAVAIMVALAPAT
ncbi:hypothetical protein [Arthrobacter rhizosphaerae]|uniref:hypothetical protein n=1 Tax=Arthrobacter rhizosphaerae TaxID=2855490 RepID=UPI001FF2D2B0|nr:hypothetical protein [Arthrobacter rhizosphaerae]